MGNHYADNFLTAIESHSVTRKSWATIRPKNRSLLEMRNPNGNPRPKDAKELVGLCRAGRLYEIEKWIADGKSGAGRDRMSEWYVLQRHLHKSDERPK
jgi:hypothetical protein